MRFRRNWLLTIACGLGMLFVAGAPTPTVAGTVLYDGSSGVRSAPKKPSHPSKPSTPSAANSPRTPDIATQPSETLSTLEQQHRWALATTALLSHVNFEETTSLAGYAGYSFTPESVRREVESLARGWNVRSRADLLERLAGLDREGHRTEFTALGKALSTMTADEYRAMEKEYSDDDKMLYRMRVVRTNYAKFGNKSLFAWDYIRYINVCRMGYHVGYLSEQEAWDRIMPVARKIQRTYSSWTAMGEDYLIGYDYWRTDAEDDSLRLLKSAYALFCTDYQYNPWIVNSWTLDLGK